MLVKQPYFRVSRLTQSDKVDYWVFAIQPDQQRSLDMTTMTHSPACLLLPLNLSRGTPTLGCSFPRTGVLLRAFLTSVGLGPLASARWSQLRVRGSAISFFFCLCTSLTPTWHLCLSPVVFHLARPLPRTPSSHERQLVRRRSTTPAFSLSVVSRPRQSSGWCPFS